MADNVIDISALISEFGAYYLDNGQGVKDLRAQIMDQNETDVLFMPWPTNDTIIRGANVDFGSVLQGYQVDFTPLGEMDISGRTIELGQFKIDIQRTPDTLVRSWAGFLTSNKTDRTTWPIWKYITQSWLIPKSAEDWELNAVFAGVKGAVTPGTAQAVADAIDGIRKIINDAITATDITPIVTGEPSTDPVTWVEQVEAFADAIPKKFMPHIGPIAMSFTLYKRFKKGMRMKYNMNYQQADLVTVIDTNLQVVGLRSHEGSGKIWTTVKGNAVMPIKGPENQNVFEVEKVDRKVKIYTDWFKGVGFWRYDWIFTNDADLD